MLLSLKNLYNILMFNNYQILENWGPSVIYIYGGINMQNINWKIFNISLWIEVILSYVLPYKVIDSFECKIGFPIPFISIYDTTIGVNPLTSMFLNPLEFLLNGFIIYLIIQFTVTLYYKIKNSTTK